MGTRNLTIVRVKVKNKKQVKVAQYGQWDGYPTGQGQEIADFLKKADLKKFKKQVAALEAYTPEEVEKIYRTYDPGNNSGYIEISIAEKIDKAYPALCRDHGAGILQLIHDGTVKKVVLDEGFKEDTVFCEYCYTIDLDDETVDINGTTYTFAQWTRKNAMKRLEAKENQYDE